MYCISGEYQLHVTNHKWYTNIINQMCIHYTKITVTLLYECLANDTSSGSEDELSSQLMDKLLNSQDDIDSDAESVDSEQENALK